MHACGDGWVGGLAAAVWLQSAAQHMMVRPQHMVVKTTSHDGQTTSHDGQTTSHDGQTTAHDGQTTSHDGQTTTAHDGQTTSGVRCCPWTSFSTLRKATKRKKRKVYTVQRLKWEPHKAAALSSKRLA